MQNYSALAALPLFSTPQPFSHGSSMGPRLTAWSTTGCSRGFVERTRTATLGHGPREALHTAEHHALPVHAFRARGNS
eukprot:7920171-Pyramimonas_sp.AAC.1